MNSMQDNYIIDFLESFEHTGIYIVDRETMEVYYENKTAKKYTVKDRIGQPCFLAHGNRAMCVSCPLRNKDRVTYVNREDYGMVFSVSAKDTVWKGIPTYTIIVEKAKDLPVRSSLSEASMERLNRALHSSIIAYVDVNMDTEMCQAIHFSEDGNHKVYDIPYDEYMRKICFKEYVFPEDHIRSEKILGIEHLRQMSEDSEDSGETNIRFRIRENDGQIHVLESTAYVLKDELPHHVSIIAKEVTLEEKSRVQLSLYNKLISSSVLTYQLNLTRNIFQNVIGYDILTQHVRGELDSCTSIDDFYKLIVQYTVGEDEKKKAEAFFDRTGQIALFENSNSILRERLPIDMDDGTFMWLDVTCNMLKNPMTGDVEGILYTETVDEDVISENMINQMIRNDYDYLAVFDVMNHTNKVYTSNENYSKEQLEKNLSADSREAYFRKIYAGDDIEAFIYHNTASYIHKRLAVEEKFDNYYYVKEEDGSISYKKETLSYLNGDQRYILFSRTDNTNAVKRQEALNMKLSQALEEAKKATEEKAELFARMSHDLRTPMNGILGMTELSMKEQDLHVLHKNMQRIDSSGKYMLRMINDTLDMKRIETGNIILDPKPNLCRSFIDNLIEMFKPTLQEKNLSFQMINKNIDLDRYAFFDGVRMKQIFTNMMSNAFKYTPEGGSILLSMECIKHENNCDYDVFEITDTGIGMSREFLKYMLFKPYAQENNNLTGKYAGPGLGLAITKSIVDLMGGRIEVESELGEGTTFRVYVEIPIISNEKAEKLLSEKNNTVHTAKVMLDQKKILLCEDHPLNAEISRKLLERVGCEVVWAADGKQGLDFITESAPFTYDAVLMDIRMPVMNGIEAAKAIRSLARPDALTIPIIAMTANAFEEDKKQSVQAGMNEHLAKPVVPEMLYKTLEKYM